MMISNKLFLTAHDFRTPRKVDLHFMAHELAKTGRVRFFSLRYSWLSNKRPDGRHVISECANKVERVSGVDCFLWKTLLHPINTRIKLLRPLEAMAYKLYVFLAPKLLKQWIKEADTIFFESGISPVFFDFVKKLNPQAQTIYLTSDTQRSINVAQYVIDATYRASSQFDKIWVPSKLMTEDFAPDSNIIYIPRAIDENIQSYADPSPYKEGTKNVVSVGSMLFDSTFFECMGHAYPDIAFHVIGCGCERPKAWPENVYHYNEMAFNDTIPFIKHAHVGIAPYVSENIPPSLADTSMKLFQYAFFGIPAVCPIQVVGEYPYRFGYNVRDKQSMIKAMEAALASEKRQQTSILNWKKFIEALLGDE